MGGKIEWVEIIEPRSREKMFVNLQTGECGWDEPLGVKIKRIHEQDGHQWWELYDVKTSRFYYYNSSTQQTCWQKPKSSSSIIIPLAKLQLLKQNNLSNGSNGTSTPETKQTRDVSVQTKNSCLVLVNNSTQTTPPPSLRRGMCYTMSSGAAAAGDGNDTWSAKRSLRNYLINEARFARGLTGLNQEDLAMSDYDEDFWESDDGEDGSTTSDQWDADDEIDHNEKEDEEEEEDEDAEEEKEKEPEEKPKVRVSPKRMPETKVVRDTTPKHAVPETAGTSDSHEEDADEDVAIVSLKSSGNSNSLNNSVNDQKSSLSEANSFVYLKGHPSPPKLHPKPAAPISTATAPHKSASFTSSAALVQRSQSIKDARRPDFQNNLSKNYKRMSIAGTERGLPLEEDTKPEPPPHLTRVRQPTPPQRGLSLSTYDTSYLPSPPKIGPVASPPKIKPSPSLSSQSFTSPAQSSLDSNGRRHRDASAQFKSGMLPDESSLSRMRNLSLGSRSHNSSKINNNDEKGSQEMEAFVRENVARHIKPGVGNHLLKRKTSLKAMLSWSKKCIKSPMIATLMSTGASTRAEIKTEAIHCFELIQLFMGDRVPADKKESAMTREEIAFQLISIACSRHELRDEIFVQLCRQTTDNPRKISVVLGLHLMACCLTYFHPSVKFSPYLASYLSNSQLKQLPALAEKEDIDAISLLDHCHHLLIKVRGAFLGSGTGGGGSATIYCRRPVTSKEIEMVFEAIERRFPGIYGENLSALMTLQSRRWPQKRLPWVLTTLCEAVLKMGGAATEGIFRIAADADEMSFVKLVIDCINFDLLEDEGDILDLLNHSSEEPIDVHVFACLLKQWFRSLMEPLIPFNLYDVCLEYSSSPSDATSIVINQLPTLNRMVIGYLIRFLQVFAAPENVNFTKMDDSNLSMVWAPNILRSPQSNNLDIHPSIIFENTRKEMTFIRTLIQSLDTSYIQGVY